MQVRVHSELDLGQKSQVSLVDAELAAEKALIQINCITNVFILHHIQELVLHGDGAREIGRVVP